MRTGSTHWAFDYRHLRRCVGKREMRQAWSSSEGQKKAGCGVRAVEKTFWVWRGEPVVAVVEMVVVEVWMCQMSRTRRETVEDLGAERRQEQGSFGLVPYSGGSAMWHLCFETWRSRGYRIEYRYRSIQALERSVGDCCTEIAALCQQYEYITRKQCLKSELNSKFFMRQSGRQNSQSVSQSINNVGQDHRMNRMGGGQR